MHKEFDRWNQKKKAIQIASIDSVFFKEQEVWWCSLGANVGFEQDGKGESFRRPILIIKKFNQHLVWAVPLTSQPKEGIYYVPCELPDGTARQAIISQTRPIDTKRLIDKMGRASDESFKAIKKAIRNMF